MSRALWYKNKKGAALIFAVMVLFLLATVIVAVTALASSSFSDAILTVSDDQSYYYAKSVGLSVKEQLKDGYNINKIIDQLNLLEDSDVEDPKISGTYNIANGDGEFASGTVQIRYAHSDSGEANEKVIEVTTTCILNNSLSIVTSIFSCEEDTPELELADYDVILTNTKNLSLDFAEAGEGDGNDLRVYVYAGENDNVKNDDFKLYVNMAGTLTTTGGTTITSLNRDGTVRYGGTISGKLVSYGNLELKNIYVIPDGGKNPVPYGVHADGDVTLTGLTLISGDIYARGKVTINQPCSGSSYLHTYAIVPGGANYFTGSATGQSVSNIFAQGDVTVMTRALVGGSIYSHGNVTVRGARNTSHPYGDACVVGDIYADGDVVIEEGAIVLGSIYAKGNVTVRNGAFVRLIIQSVNGNVSVLGGAVGAWVNCPNGTLTVGNKGYQNGSAYLGSVASQDPMGVVHYSNIITFGGIGLLYTGISNCSIFVTHDLDEFVKVGGDLYVSSHAKNSIYTDILSVWVTGNLFLKDSVARFDNGGSRVYRGKNQYDNYYTNIIGYLCQVRDLYNTVDSPWVDMAGARIGGNLLVGESDKTLRDCYLYNGWIDGGIFARCAFLCDMMFTSTSSIHAQQYLHLYANGLAKDNSRGRYVDQYMEIPAGMMIQVEAMDLTYEGEFVTETRYGMTVGRYVKVKNGAGIAVGSSRANTDNAIVVIGDEGMAGTTYFYGLLHAYVGNFVLTANARLSDKNTDVPTSNAAYICAEITGGGTFRVDASGTKGGQHRYGSTVEVKGNADIAGVLYNFRHFNDATGNASFTNATTARIKGALYSDAKTLNLAGSTSFTEVHATNSSCTVTLGSDLTVAKMLVNGTLRVNDKTLTVNGDLYAGYLDLDKLKNVTVTGNATINHLKNGSLLKAKGTFKVTGDLYLGEGGVEIGANHSVGGTLETKGGIVTLVAGGSLNNVKSSSDFSITGGTMSGGFDVGGNFLLDGGTLEHANYVNSVVKGTYTHRSGSVKQMYINVKSSADKAVVIGGTAQARNVFIGAPSGGAEVTGGANVKYELGNLVVKKTSTIAGGMECGISVTSGNLTIGTDSASGALYGIGSGTSAPAPDEENYDPESHEDNYRVVYASGNIVWKKGAKSTYDTSPKYAAATKVSAGGDLTMGSSDYYIQGLFCDLSANGKLKVYVKMVLGIYSPNTAEVHIASGGYLGTTSQPGSNGMGANITNGNLEVYAQDSTAKLQGNNVVSGVVYIKSQMRVDARIKCQKIEGFDNFKSESGEDGLRLSLYLTKPGVTTYTLTRSLLKGPNEYTGAFTVAANLTYNSPVRVEGELRVEGILTFNGSTVKLESRGGLYCENTEVEINGTFGGNIHLPNVTSVILNAEIDGLNAPKVTSFTLNYNVNQDLSLESCNSLTVGNGKQIGGNLIIKKSGKVTNNGTITGNVQCGYYEGSGTVGKMLILQSSDKTNTVSGKVTGTIWCNGNLTINTSQTLGSKDSYIYARGNINASNATFHASMDYILTTEGNMTFTNCKQMPKIRNMKGYISFRNDSSHAATIASVLSYGTYVEFGNSTTTGYQTVNGNFEWEGNGKNGNNYGVEFWNTHTTIKGDTVLLGTGNVHLASDKFATVKAKFSGKLESTGDAGCTIEKLYINDNGDIKVTSVNLKIPVTDEAVFFCNSSTVLNMTAGVGGTFDVHTAKSVTFTSGTYSGAVWINAVTTVTVNTPLANKLTVYTADELTVNEGKTIGGDLRLHNVKKVNVYANIGGKFYHTASTPSSASAMNVIRLGTQTKQITIGGLIAARGRVVDNSKQTKSSTIAVQGAYWADQMKNLDYCTSFAFKTECSGNCTLLGGCDDKWTISNTSFNIQGRLVVICFWNEAKDTAYQIIFKKKIWANALIVNTKLADTLSDVPSSFLCTYAKSNNSSIAGANKRLLLKDLTSYTLTENVRYENSNKARTENDLVYFDDNVYLSEGNGYNGTCFASNAKFDCALYTTGQVSMYYCCTFSAGYASETNHCNYTSNSNGISVANDGIFLHTKSTMTNDNYFKHVKTFSNVAIYNGVTHIFGESEFKGCVFSGDGQSDMYKGHRSTKLFYFGDSVELYGSSRILSSGQADVDICSGRTIVWVNKGALVVRDGSWIGAERAFESNQGGTTNTNRHSLHPGIFVSDTGGGTVTLNGTNYDKGAIYVIGKDSSTPSTVTLDICAYKKIAISNYGQVYGKNRKNTTFKYVAGLYITKGSITTESHGSFGYYDIYSDVRGVSGYVKLKYHTGVTDTSAYIPNGNAYCSYLYAKQGTYEKWGTSTSHNKHTTTFSGYSVAQLTQCYTPNSSAPTVEATKTLSNFSGGYNPGFTNDLSNSKRCDGWSISGKVSAPAQPTFTTDGTVWNPATGNAEVRPVIIENTNRSLPAGRATPHAITFSCKKVNAADSTVTFSGVKAEQLFEWGISYTPTITIYHPSNAWTSAITAHFDKTKKVYWNERFIPFTWKLPYDTENGKTQAKRMLTKQSNEIIKNGTLMLKQTSSSGYYTNESQYNGSSLKDFASKIFEYRAAGKSNGDNLYDILVINSEPEWDGPLWKEPDHKRRTKILVFESGEIPYSAFFMGKGDASEDYASWYGASTNKDILSNGKNNPQKQKAWRLGDPDVSFYDGSMVFYTCANPADPYGSAAKDLHVVLPQGIGFDFVVDAENTMTVVGNGRVFLYLTSGDTIYFRAKATDKVYANPVGGLKKVGSNYVPLLYIIGAGTNIDLYIDRMPLSAFVYMPFGTSTELYDYSSGTLKAYNTFKSMANNLATFTSLYKGTGQTTTVGANRLHLLWDGTSGNARNICGTIVVDNFIYKADSNYLNFKNYDDKGKRIVIPDLSETTIYGASTKGSSTVLSKSSGTYSLRTFLEKGPGYSTKMLNWEYKGIRVDA